MSSIYEKVDKLVNEYLKEVIDIRRQIHKYPELSFEEFQTSKLVAKKLDELGLEVKTNIGKTGVIGILKGKYEGKVVGLRADMDALPLEEHTDLSFKSVNKGVMHACGHDVHTANLLGVAMILSSLKDSLRGTVKFIFQPAEENGGGGRHMVNEGALKNPDVDAMFAMHVMPIKLGSIMVGNGSVSSQSDGFTLRVKGKKAHSSTPQLGVDSILIASNIINSLQSIIFRNLDPQEVSTYSIGKISGGTAGNIIADEVEMIGMSRNISRDCRDNMISKIESISKGVASSLGGECEFILRPGYPSIVNNDEMVDIVREVAKDVVGEGMLIDMKKPMLGSEDFSYFADEVPSVFYIVGSGESESPHNSKFMVDERVFETSLEVMSKVVLSYLEN